VTELIVNSDSEKDLSFAREAITRLRGSGIYKISIKKHRRDRNLDQNALYHVGYVQPFLEWLVDDCGNESYTHLMAHSILKAMFLQTSVIDPRTGELITYTRSTTELDTKEFSDYLEKIGGFLSRDCGIERFGSNRR
jgi:hypothetical protein